MPGWCTYVYHSQSSDWLVTLASDWPINILASRRWEIFSTKIFPENIYKTHPNIAAYSLHKDLTLVWGTQAISLYQPLLLAHSLLLSSHVNSEPSVPGTAGCQILESHNWFQIPLNSLSWNNPPSHLSLLSREEQELVFWPKDLNVKVNSINFT